VPADDLGSVEDLYRLVFHPPWKRGSLDLVSWGRGHYYRNGDLQWFISAIRSGFRTTTDVPLLKLRDYQ
jgi:hypothetical protein